MYHETGHEVTYQWGGLRVGVFDLKTRCRTVKRITLFDCHQLYTYLIYYPTSKDDAKPPDCCVGV